MATIRRSARVRYSPGYYRSLHLSSTADVWVGLSRPARLRNRLTLKPEEALPEDCYRVERVIWQRKKVYNL